MAGFKAATPEMLMVRGPVVYTPAINQSIKDVTVVGAS